MEIENDLTPEEQDRVRQLMEKCQLEGVTPREVKYPDEPCRIEKLEQGEGIRCGNE